MLSLTEFVEFIFDTDTGLVDINKGHYGIVPEFNKEAIAIIEKELDLPEGGIDFMINKAVKTGLVIPKVNKDKNNVNYTVYYKKDINYRPDNSEQLRKVTSALNKFKNRDQLIKEE